MVRYLKDLHSLGLGHANRLKSWVGCNWEKEWKLSVYPVYQPAPSEYKSISLQQYTLLRLTAVPLRH